MSTEIRAKIWGLEIVRDEIAHLKNTFSLTLGFQGVEERENFIKEVFKDTQELLTWIEQKSEVGLNKKSAGRHQNEGSRSFITFGHKLYCLQDKSD